MKFDQLRNDQALASAIAAVSAEGDDIDLIRRHDCQFYVYKNDWIYGVVAKADKNLELAVARWYARNHHTKVLERSPAHNVMIDIAANGNDPVFLDIGTNYGQWVVPAQRALRNAGLRMHTVCFEPGKAGKLAKINLILNGAENAELLYSAVADFDGIIPLLAVEGHTEDNKVVNRSSNHKVMPSPVVRLDTVINGLGANRDYFIKIDTQGAEVEVLKGLGNYASSGRVTMFMEFSPLALASRRKPAEFLQDLAANFVIVASEENGKVHTLVDDGAFAALSERVSNRRIPIADLVLLPKGHKRLELMTDYALGKAVPSPMPTGAENRPLLRWLWALASRLRKPT